MKTIIIENYKAVSCMRNHFDTMQWVISARTKDKAKYLFEYVNVSDNGTIACTDSHRLHIYNPDYENIPENYKIPKGNYIVISATKQSIVLQEVENSERFPNYEKVIPEKTDCNILFSGSDNEKSISKLAHTIYRATVSCIDLSHINKFIASQDLSIQVSDDKNKAILITGQNIKLVMMPLYTDDYK